MNYANFKLCMKLAAMLCVVGLLWDEAEAQDISTIPNIAVSGTGEVYAKPDTAIATVGMDVIAPMLADALKQAGDGAAKVVGAVKAQGIDSTDMQTSSYNINPVMTQPKNGEDAKVAGYDVSYTYSIKIRNMDNVGKVMDAVIAAGANSVNGISFIINDSAPLETEARVAAVANAQGKAATLAKAAGVKLGRMLSLSEQGGVYQQNAPMAFALAKVSGAGPIEAGQASVKVTVQMSYEILQ